MKRHKIQIIALMAITMSAFNCSNSGEQMETLSNTNLNPNLAWYQDNLQALEEYIHNHGINGPNYHQNEYVVFDFDNTVIYSDIENCLVAYMANHGLVKRPPNNDWTLISPHASQALIDRLDTHCGGNSEYLQSNTNEACADTIFSAYYEGTVSSEDDAEDAFTINSTKLYRPDYAFGGQIMRGHTTGMAKKISLDTADWCLGLGLEEEVKVGPKTYTLAIRFYEEILAIMNALDRAGIDFVISTASPEYLVQATAQRHLNIPPERVIGVRLKIENGLYTGNTIAIGDYAETEVMNYQLGKVISLLEFYEGVSTTGMTDRDIIDTANISAGFCDSDTDAQFIKSAKHMAFCLNRNKSGIMCPMYHWQANGDPERPDKVFLINPIFIEEQAKSKKTDPYDCSVDLLPEGLGISSIANEIPDTVFWQ